MTQNLKLLLNKHILIYNLINYGVEYIIEKTNIINAKKMICNSVNICKKNKKNIRYKISYRVITNLNRCFEYCVICKLHNHKSISCFKYKNFKNKLTNNNYVLYNTLKLSQCDENGFCASGIIPYTKVNNKIYLLMLKEVRQNKPGINFIAGKRENIYINYNNVRFETSYETALNEFEEELSALVTNKSLNELIKEIKNTSPNSCFWSYQSKMSLYSIEISNKFLNKLKIKKSINKNAEPFDIIWINTSNYKKYIGSQSINSICFHEFTINIINQIKSLHPLETINYLFEKEIL